MKSQYFLKLGFTLDTSDFMSRLIHKVTKGPSHALIEVFEIKPNGQHERYFFESIWKKDPVTGKNGVRGPVPLMNLIEWVNEKPRRTLVEVPADGYLPLTQEEAAYAVDQLRKATKTVYYATSQLGTNLTAAALSVSLTFGGGSAKRWTCSETPIRCHVIPPRFWDIVGMENINADDIWPGGSERYSLLAAARRIVDWHGAIFP